MVARLPGMYSLEHSAFSIKALFTNAVNLRRYPSVCARRWSSAGVSSPVELHSLGRVYGRLAVVQAASPPSPRGQWVQGNDESRYCLGTNGVTGAAGVALSCQTAFGTPAPDYLSGFTRLAFPRTGRPQCSSGV